LANYDYSQNGMYFVTICTKDREYLLGEILGGKLKETVQSKIVMACWMDLENHYSNCILDEFVIMPNYIHGIIGLFNPVETGFVETGLRPVSTITTEITKQHSLSEIIRAFKSFSARRINELQSTPGFSFWQFRFYDRIIRNEKELNRIREYIYKNPANWEKDKNNLENLDV